MVFMFLVLELHSVGVVRTVWHLVLETGNWKLQTSLAGWAGMGRDAIGSGLWFAGYV
jgi:hypothetical protein